MILRDADLKGICICFESEDTANCAVCDDNPNRNMTGAISEMRKIAHLGKVMDIGFKLGEGKKRLNMTIKNRIEKRAMKLVDWQEIKFLTDEIEELIGNTENYHLDYTDDMLRCIEKMKNIFEAAREQASEEIMNERDKEE